MEQKSNREDAVVSPGDSLLSLRRKWFGLLLCSPHMLMKIASVQVMAGFYWRTVVSLSGWNSTIGSRSERKEREENRRTERSRGRRESAFHWFQQDTNNWQITECQLVINVSLKSVWSQWAYEASLVQLTRTCKQKTEQFKGESFKPRKNKRSVGFMYWSDQCSHTFTQAHGKLNVSAARLALSVSTPAVQLQLFNVHTKWLVMQTVVSVANQPLRPISN